MSSSEDSAPSNLQQISSDNEDFESISHKSTLDYQNNIPDSKPSQTHDEISPWASVEVFGNNPDYQGQKDNIVKTTRYTILTFIPLTLFENFRNLSNIYFLIVMLVSFLPISPVGYIFQLLPLVFVILVSMVKAAIEDLLKGKEDKKRNQQKVHVYRDGVFKDICSSELVVGDVLKITEDEMVPTDLLYIGSSQEEKLCYFSETNLNGETAVKTMSCFPLFKDTDAINELSSKKYYVDLGEPDRDLTRFDARMRCGDKFWSISIHNVLLRGVCTHYTENVLGIVLRTGHDTKIMKNIKHPPAKMTSFDKKLNKMLIVIFIVNLIICVISAGLGCYKERNTSFTLISQLIKPLGTSYTEYFVQFFILYSYFIPISLMVTIELLRLYHKIIIDFDPEFFDVEFGHASAHNSNQIGQLGLVTHILSDKTGTLTENIMEMLKFSVKDGQFDAHDFLKAIEADPNFVTPTIPFLLALALCNNVIVHVSNTGKIEYNADSPDEAAFVNYAASCGVRLISRDLTSMTIDIRGTRKVYKVLAVLPFNSDRKRMSILVKADGEDAILYCKGADNVIHERSVDFNCTDTVNDYAATGLRTLVFTERTIVEPEFTEWTTRFHEAESSLIDRDAKIEAAAALVECKLNVIGVTGVEDRLQPQVPQTIEWLRNAHIKVWILTGDKLETAIAIGRTSGVIQPGSDVLIISNDEKDTVKRRLRILRDDIDTFTNPVLIVTAVAVEYCLNDFFEEFMDIAKQVSAVILSRVSPFMKAQVTNAVRDHGGMTLAIGDGANDVGMIQVAHVGVGVYGREGSQAAQSADFAIPRFKHLIRLLTVHGHWTYYRFSNVAMIMLYKNFAFILCQLWFSFFSLWSPQSYYNDFFLSVFNLVFTVLPPFIYGCTEQDLPQYILKKTPDLYPVQHDPMMVKNLIYYLFVAVYQSVIAYFGTFFNMGNDTLVANGVISYLAVTYIVVIQVILWSNYHNIIGFILYPINIVFVPIITIIDLAAFNEPLKGVFTHTLASAYSWLGLIATIIVAIIPSFIIEYARKRFSPSKVRIYEEKAAIGIQNRKNNNLRRTWSQFGGHELRRYASGTVDGEVVRTEEQIANTNIEEQP
ncbi:putative phospholipid-transporting ATPase DRS2 [Tritrichomonas foetus]|uniref:Phospholipid-transporting ATPase n=1 Tax=Tritrichomonas foetus TaxID=1144522 RepID=A0A1J4KD76_9EUKA|nr:putative phospholipid-transporting ATPase DRS2 [Tritrichomonas foetus]|eukprot:OHT08930.1 putative phospholipid-transporting ATPase DRS2 [Tritrichomonas foetus]